jgi:hypothetical protein
MVPRVPVLIPGASTSMAAVGKWTPSYLRERFGRSVVRVDGGSQFEMLTLAEFIERIERNARDDASFDGTPREGVSREGVSREGMLDDGVPGALLGGGTVRPYLRNLFLAEVMPELVADVSLPIYGNPNWLTSKALEGFIPPSWRTWIELFVSGPGTRFPRVHVDSSMTHAWVIGVHGRKRFWAWPPQPNQPNYSIHSELHRQQRGLDCRGADLNAFFPHASPVVADIGPGDYLFLPTGWWHTAESLTTSVSLSGNFVNETNWDEFVECWFRGLRFRPGLASMGEALLSGGILEAARRAQPSAVE